MTIKEYVAEPIYYPNRGTEILAIDKGGGFRKLMDVRGWGYISTEIKNLEEAEKFQDDFGLWVVEAMKEKLEREK